MSAIVMVDGHSGAPKDPVILFGGRPASPSKTTAGDTPSLVFMLLTGFKARRLTAVGPTYMHVSSSVLP